MKDWTTTRECESRGHCHRCLLPLDHPRSIRAQAATKFRFPPPETCPFGMTLQWVTVEGSDTREPRAVQPSGSIAAQAGRVVRAVAHGAASIVKTSAGVDLATDEQIEARLSVCRACPGGHATFKPDGSLHTCGSMLESLREQGRKTCGCVLNKKARDLAEDCPFGWWPNVAT